jgi:hypothetical protein
MRHILIITNFNCDIIKGDEAMARAKDEKAENLKKYGALNPHPQKVVEKTFSESTIEFFDPRDLVQVKYEMLRAVEKEGHSVKHASQTFGFSRPAFYQATPSNTKWILPPLQLLILSIISFYVLQ